MYDKERALRVAKDTALLAWVQTYFKHKHGSRPKLPFKQVLRDIVADLRAKGKDTMVAVLESKLQS